MIKLFKKHFIPHEENDHQPHFLRMKNIRNIIAIIFILQLFVAVIPFLPILNLSNNSYLASVLPGVLDNLTNQNRKDQNLATLKVSPLLNKVAELKAKDMAEKGYFAHVNPEGKEPWYWFNLVGYNYAFAGENLAVDFTDSLDVSKAWMNSPTHRANIVKNSYTEMGTGVATGTFNGRPTIFVAQVFGKPAVSNIALAPITPTSNTNAETVATTTPIVVSNVKGASAEPTSIPTQTAVTQVVGEPVVEVPAVVEQVVKEPVAEVSTVVESKTNTLQKFATSPRHIVNIIFAILAVLVASALLFKLFIRMDKRHPILITNGLIVLVLIFGVYTVDNYITKSKMQTTTSFVSF